MNMLIFPYDSHLSQLVGLLLSHRSQEDFFFFPEKAEKYDLSPFTLAQVPFILIITDHSPPLV